MTAELEPVARIEPEALKELEKWPGASATVWSGKARHRFAEDATPLVTLSSAQEAIDKREERIHELEAAIDEKEIASGLTSDGNLWRYWSNIAKGLALKKADLTRERDALQALLDEVGEVIEPFAGYVVPDPDPNSVSGERFGTKPDLKAFRAARSLAAKIKEAKGPACGQTVDKP